MATSTRFAFNFDVAAEPDVDPPLEKSVSVPVVRTDPTEWAGDSSSNSRPFVWCDDLRERLLARGEQSIVFREVYQDNNNQDGENDGDIDNDESHVLVRYVDVESSSLVAAEADVMVAGVYEGGQTIWEGSIDLVRFLATCSDTELFGAVEMNDENENDNDDNENDNQRHGGVLELGCGHALPSIYLLKRWLQRYNTSNCRHPLSFCLVDYNDFVLHNVTLANLVLNVVQQDAGDDERVRVLDQVADLVHLGSGDWLDFSQKLLETTSEGVNETETLGDNNNDNNDSRHCHPTSRPLSSSSSSLLPGTFRIILAAETLYSLAATVATAQLLARHLSRDATSCAYVATKRYYFGVGGGTFAFVEAAQQYDLHVQELVVVDHGAGNIRQILKVTRGGDKAAVAGRDEGH